MGPPRKRPCVSWCELPATMAASRVLPHSTCSHVTPSSHCTIRSALFPSFFAFPLGPLTVFKTAHVYACSISSTPGTHLHDCEVALLWPHNAVYGDLAWVQHRQLNAAMAARVWRHGSANMLSNRWVCVPMQSGWATDEYVCRHGCARVGA